LNNENVDWFEWAIKRSLASQKETGNLIKHLDEIGRQKEFLFKLFKETRFGCLFSISKGEVEIARGSIHLSEKRSVPHIWLGLPNSTTLKHFESFNGVKLVIIEDRKYQNYIALQLRSSAKLKRYRDGLCFNVYCEYGQYKISDGIDIIVVKNISEVREFAIKLYEKLCEFAEKL